VILSVASNWEFFGGDEVMRWLPPGPIGWVYAHTFHDLEQDEKYGTVELLRKVLVDAWKEKPSDEIRAFFEHLAKLLCDLVQELPDDDGRGDALWILVHLKRRGVYQKTTDAELFEWLQDWEPEGAGSPPIDAPPPEMTWNWEERGISRLTMSGNASTRA
jgi:hypothetical protein